MRMIFSVMLCGMALGLIVQPALGQELVEGGWAGGPGHTLEDDPLGATAYKAAAQEEVLPIAHGLQKWLGCAYSSSQRRDFTRYWNQVTPENGGKWGMVERTRDVMVWTEMDSSYNLARRHGFPVRFHALVWGNQQPTWMHALDSLEQMEEIHEWFDTIAKRYPDLEYIEVVNEPLHDPPRMTGPTDFEAGGYYEALGGSGVTGWDWIVNAFRLARQYFPHAKLMINDYNIIGGGPPDNVIRYREIVRLLQQDTLIDIVGFQGHAFSTRGSAASMRRNLDTLATTGLPLMATEVEIDGPTDLTQLRDYQRIFPVIWEHPAVMGVTKWGFRPGMWRTEQRAFIIRPDGTERPALVWLRAYVQGTWVPVTDFTISTEGNVTQIDSIGGTLQFHAQVQPDTATLPNPFWSVSNTAIAHISPTGLLTARGEGAITVTATAGDGSTMTRTMQITIDDPLTSATSSALQGVRVYPNPASDHVTVASPNALSRILIFNTLGQLVVQVNGPQAESRIDIQHLSPGIYLIHALGADGAQERFRLIKK